MDDEGFPARTPDSLERDHTPTPGQEEGEVEEREEQFITIDEAEMDSEEEDIETLYSTLQKISIKKERLERRITEMQRRTGAIRKAKDERRGETETPQEDYREPLSGRDELGISGCGEV